MPDVLLATCAAAAGLDDDEPLLLAALADAGVTAATADWDDPAVAWSAARLVVVRSTWNYAPRRAEFVAWAERVAAATTLRNPAPVIAWNTDKRYLAELAGAGVPTVPTAWVAAEVEVEPALSKWSGDVVVKPVVSAGAQDTARFGTDERRAAASLALQILAGGRAVMVQPYLTRLETEAETGLVYVAGDYSHAFAKGAMLATGPAGTGLFAEERITARVATAQQRAVADRVLAAAVARTGEVPLYARVDLVPDDDGAPQLLELELTEPSLNLALDDAAAARFATAIAAHLD